MIKDINTEDLIAEIERRKKTEQELLIPMQIITPDIKPLQVVCQNYIDEIAKDGYIDEDFDHYISECAMEVVFGKNVWEFINKNQGGLF